MRKLQHLCTMCDSSTNINHNHGLMNAKDVAKYLGKSLSWVYKHKHELGGRKLGGSWFFPEKKELHERIFRQKKGMEIRLPNEQKALHRSVFQNENRSQTGRSTKKGGTKKSKEKETNRDDPNRHGLLDIA